MTAQQLFLSLRFILNDMERSRFSDYQLTESVNSVLSIINNALAKSNSELITEETDLTLVSGVVDLPVDFQSMVNVFAGTNLLSYQSKSSDSSSNTYRIRGNKIYSTNETLTIHYKKTFLPIDTDDLSVSLPVPDYFSELLKKYTVIIMQGGISKTETPIVQQISDDVYKLTAGREYSAIDFAPTFKV
jgi:hypothetical protein